MDSCGVKKLGKGEAKEESTNLLTAITAENKFLCCVDNKLFCTAVVCGQ